MLAKRIPKAAVRRTFSREAGFQGNSRRQIAFASLAGSRWSSGEVSVERAQCLRIVGQPKGTREYVPTLKSHEYQLFRKVLLLASDYSYGYCGMAAMQSPSGIEVEKDWVQRIGRRVGLQQLQLWFSW